MIPNIFISSTVTDLHYLRDALRDAVLELCYTPIMSDYGEVGYISPTSAADSCFRTVRQCQLAICVIGKRYGKIDKEGFSVTHREFLTAKDHRIPTIAFVESQVMNYKEVYDVDPSAPTWKNFSGMDHPNKTFGFIEDVKSSESYNGLIPITTAGEAKRLLKLQIADFVGERLNDVIQPVKTDVQNILAEIRTLRSEITPKSQQNPEAQKYLSAMRFLLDDQRAGFRKFCEVVSGDLDVAVPLLIKYDNFDSFVKSLNLEVIIEEHSDNFMQMMSMKVRDGENLKYASHGGEGWWAATADNKLIFSSRQLGTFRSTYDQLRRRISTI